ncbi:NUDIX hydrolase [Haloechinothrix salitolerans]|uniref:NUDIX hydrolase n=1 Tax=Haloechinothrix salitolerans TaxID=926830 RepID=A0ABW2C441_9PSEU
MSGYDASGARTVLEQLIRQRRQTFEEFVEFAARFAREHGEPGTLSLRHLQRLVAGRRPDGAPVGPPRPATARLLERIFGMPISVLLSESAADTNVLEARALHVAVAVVVHDARVLLVCRREEPDGEIRWQFPAGIVKPGRDPRWVAVSEVLAETAVHCLVVRSLGSRIHPVTRVYCDYVLCEYVVGTTSNADTVENAGVAWADRSQMIRLIPVERIYPPVLDALDARLATHA